MTVGHESDLESVQSALAKTCLQTAPVALSVEEALDCPSNLCLLVQDTLPLNTYQRILKDASEGSTLYVIDSSCKTLQDAKVLFGDNVPRGQVGKAAYGVKQQLSLNLFETHASVSQHNDAEMDPWLNVLTQDEFAELVSARIVTRD